MKRAMRFMDMTKLSHEFRAVRYGTILVLQAVACDSLTTLLFKLGWICTAAIDSMSTMQTFFTFAETVKDRDANEPMTDDHLLHAVPIFIVFVMVPFVMVLSIVLDENARTFCAPRES